MEKKSGEPKPNFPNIAQPRSELERSPLITLKPEHKEFLTTLLAIYQTKLRYALDKRELKYKIAILQKLLIDKAVDSLEISKVLARSADFSVGIFKTACGKIDTCNGTGEDIDGVLPAEKENETLELKADKKATLARILQLEQRRIKLIETLKSMPTGEGLNKIQEEIDRCEDTIAILKRFAARPD